MSDKPLTLLEAIREESDLLDQRVKHYKALREKDKDALSLRDIVQIDTWEAMRYSYLRILERYEQGMEINLGIVDGKTTLVRKKTTRHLERDNPAVAKAKRNLDFLVGLTDGDTDV
jgi:hypothetical protein